MTMPPAATPSVLVFDVNETLLDIESLAPFFGDVFGDPRVLREWYAQLVLYSMTVTMTGDYLDFSRLALGVLRMLGDIHQAEISDDDVYRLKAGLLALPAHPDVPEGLGILLDNGFRLATLTNSPPNPDGATALENAGLADFFEHRLSVDGRHAFKPSPAVYEYAARTLEVAPTDCMMVAAHVWDDLGARHVGFSSALILRAGNAPLLVDGLPQPDLVVGDLLELADRLTGPR